MLPHQRPSCGSSYNPNPKSSLRAVQVGDALLDVIFDPEEADAAGLVIDGFPRTALQVDLALRVGFEGI